MKISRLTHTDKVNNYFEASSKVSLPSFCELKDNSTDPVQDLLQWNENEKRKIQELPRWDTSRIPLKFFINECNNDKFLPEFTDSATSAFLPWSRASLGLIRFERIYNEANADIIISWTDKITTGRSFEAGNNNLKLKHNKIEKAEISIVIYPLIDRDGNTLSRPERVRRTALHEIGHALGLNHSNSSKDVMFHRGIYNKNLSKNDIRRLNELYKYKSPDIIV